MALLVGTGTVRVLKTRVVTVRVPLVVRAELVAICSGLEKDVEVLALEASQAASSDSESGPLLCLPEDSDELESEPLWPLLPVDPDPVVPVSTGDDAPVELASAAVTGHTVVVTAMISVVTEPRRAGQSVTIGAHDVIV